MEGRGEASVTDLVCGVVVVVVLVLFFFVTDLTV